MEPHRFDVLARLISMASSRRQVLRLLVGGIGRAVSAGAATAIAVSAGLGRPRQVMAQATPCQIRTVKVWLNAFIPGTVPGVTRSVPAGPFAGKSMIDNPLALLVFWGPKVGDCFITDNRSFSADPTASSRMHSAIEIDVEAGTIVGGGMGTQRIGETVEVDCEDGAVECRKTGPTNRMAFSNFQVRSGAGGERIFLVDLKAAGQDWCFEWSPQTLVCDIDYQGTFTIEVSKARDKASVMFDGLIDAFPAYEAYAATNDRPAQILFQEMPPPGNTPFVLCDNPAAAPRRPLRANVDLSCPRRAAGLYQTDTANPSAAGIFFNRGLLPENATLFPWTVQSFHTDLTIDPATGGLSGSLAIHIYSAAAEAEQAGRYYDRTFTGTVSGGALNEGDVGHVWFAGTEVLLASYPPGDERRLPESGYGERKEESSSYGAYFAVDPENNVLILCPLNDLIPRPDLYPLESRHACINEPYAALQPVLPA